MKKSIPLILASAPFAAGAAAAAGLVYLIAPGSRNKSMAAQFAGRNIAHRGLFAKDQSIPENSLPAFRAAVEAGYGIELDVQLSEDGKVVVFHDDDLKRVCGVDKRVDALPYEELKKLSLCGTAEYIPLFSEVLAAVGGKVPLIVELKSGHRNTELCEKTWGMLTRYRGPFCIESFDPRIVRWFYLQAPYILRGQLATTADDYGKQPKVNAFLMSNGLLNWLGRPQFIAYRLAEKPFTIRLAEKLGAMRVCWTSHEEGHEPENDVVIFEHYRPALTFPHRK